MLILTRCIGEQIVIGDDVTVTILNVCGAQVSLGVSAPNDISIHRLEIYNKIHEKRVENEPLENDSYPIVEFNSRDY